MRGLIASVLIWVATLSGTAVGEEWPSRPITLIVPFAAGGPSDILARVFAQRLGEILGQQIVVENVGGAGGTIGSNRVAKAAPDGSQFVFGNIGTHVWSQLIYKRPAYNSVTEFVPVALVSGGARVLITRKDFPGDSLTAFVQYVKAAGEKATFGSAGAGSVSHISCVLLNAIAGLTPTHVPYRGAGPALQDLLAGRIDYMCESGSTALAYIEAKLVKPIAVLGSSRAALLPHVAPAHEQGLSSLYVSGWNALFLPKGTPENIVRRLNQAANEALETPSVRQRFEALTSDVAPREQRTPEYLARLLQTELERWRAPLKSAGVVMD